AMAEAFAMASALSPRVLVERQIAGICHRVHVANGEVVAASRRLPKSVRGDGERTVSALIDEANAVEAAKPPWSRLKPFPSDALAIQCLAKAGLNLASIPAAGQLAPLRPVQSIAWGGVVEDFLGTIHPDNVRLALQATRVLRLSSAGVDIMSEDIRQPW